MSEEQYLIKNIAAEMFVDDGEHLQRLEKFGKTLAEETIRQKRQFIELIISHFGNTKLNEIKISEIETYLLNDRRHSGSWKNFYLETFGNIFDESIWKCTNPVPKPHFQRFARNSRKPDIFTNEELSLLLQRNFWDSDTEWLLFYVTATCGLRLGEARAIQIRQIKPAEGMLVVDGFMKRNGERTKFNKKGNINDRKIRCVPIPEKTLTEIKRYVAGRKTGQDDYLFIDKKGSSYSIGHLENAFKKALKKSDIDTNGKKFVPHSLRFTYVTKMRTAFSVEDVRKIAGHASAEMTEYYTRAMISDMCKSLQPAKKKVNELFF